MHAEIKQFQELIRAFETSPLAFAILDSELHVIYANKVLSERYPDLQNPARLYFLFKGVDKPTVLGYLKGERSYEFTCNLPDQQDAKITLNALFSEDEQFLGATALISPKADMPGFFPEDKPSEYHQAVNREFRLRLHQIFNAIHYISHIEDFEPSPAYCESLSNINQNCYQLLRVGKNLEKLLLLSDKNEKAFFQLVNFTEFVTKLTTTVIKLNTTNIPIEFVCNCGALPARIDLVRMETAISNIILNSIKYTRDGNEVKITLNRVGDNALLSISDKGAGMPRDVLSKAGTPYFSYSHEEKFEPGFGIGLYLAKKYVSCHAGIFSIQSEEGVGTTVTISIPIDIEKKGGIVNEITFERPAVFNPDALFSETRVQLSEVFYYPKI